MLFTVSGLVDGGDDDFVEPDVPLRDDGCEGRFAKAYIRDEIPWMDLRHEVRDLMILAVPALADICDDLTFEDQEIPYDGLESCWAEPAEVVPEIKAIASAPAMAALAPASDVMMVAPPSAVAMICMPVESTQASEPAEVLEEAQEDGPWAEVPIPEMEVPASADPVEMTVISPETDDSPEVEIDEPATITEDSPTVMFSFGSQEIGRGGWRVCFSF